MESESRHTGSRIATIPRPAAEQDLTQIFHMAAKALPEAWPLSALEASLELTHHRLMVIEQPNTLLAGYYLVSRVEHDIELLQLVVAPSCRRQKIGSQLLQHLITNTTSGDTITLEVRASNQAAISFYQRHRFRQISTRPNYYRPTPPSQQREDAVIMQFCADSDP